MTKVFQRADGLARVKVYSRSDHYFSFCEETWREHENESAGRSVWLLATDYNGGMHARYEEAEKDARSTIPWMHVGLGT